MHVPARRPERPGLFAAQPGVLSCESAPMQIHGPGYCSCHAPSPATPGAAPSTGFFVLILSLSLVLIGLVVQGVIPLAW